MTSAIAAVILSSGVAEASDWGVLPPKDPARTPTLAAATAAATAIAYGQIEGYARPYGRDVSTMEVVHLAKGRLPEKVRFYSGCCISSHTLGHHVLVFLEPSGESDPA